jgi:hypothetical protein
MMQSLYIHRSVWFWLAGEILCIPCDRTEVWGRKTWGYTHLLCLSFPNVCQEDLDFEMKPVPEMTRAVPEASPPRFV